MFWQYITFQNDKRISDRVYSLHCDFRFDFPCWNEFFNILHSQVKTQRNENKAFGLTKLFPPENRTKEVAAIVLLSYVSELHSHNFVRDA